MTDLRSIVVCAAVSIGIFWFSVDDSLGAEQDRYAARRLAAAHYLAHGRVEKAVAEYLKILAQDPKDAQARTRVKSIVTHRMPMWLPEEAEKAWPFEYDVVKFTPVAEPSTHPGSSSAESYRLLITRSGFAAQEGARWDELHETGFPLIDYAYVWQPVKRRYEVRIAAHWETTEQADLAQKAPRATLAFYCLVKNTLNFDPTGRWGDPIDLWVTSKGQPGARAQGRSIYLYAAGTPRTPGEWLREVGHEYGHVSFPGIGRFDETDDPWADGHLAEILLPKWLTANGVPEWMPWSATDWQAEMEPERQRLLGLWTKDAIEALLDGSSSGVEFEPGLEGRDLLLGLALWVEQAGGPEKLSEALLKCPEGTAAQFVLAVQEVGLDIDD